jgi:hypothetical protein
LLKPLAYDPSAKLYANVALAILTVLRVLLPPLLTVLRILLLLVWIEVSLVLLRALNKLQIFLVMRLPHFFTLLVAFFGMLNKAPVLRSRMKPLLFKVLLRHFKTMMVLLETL